MGNAGYIAFPTKIIFLFIFKIIGITMWLSRTELNDTATIRKETIKTKNKTKVLSKN